MLAARSGQVDAVETLADAGAELDAQESWNGQSALMWAGAEGHVPLVGDPDLPWAPTSARALEQRRDAASVRRAQGAASAPCAPCSRRGPT